VQLSIIYKKLYIWDIQTQYKKYSFENQLQVCITVV